MIDEKNFGNRLTECMKIAGYTNSKLTEALSLSKNAVGNYKKIKYLMLVFYTIYPNYLGLL